MRKTGSRLQKNKAFLEEEKKIINQAFSKFTPYQLEGITKVIKNAFKDVDIEALKDLTEAITFKGIELEPYLKNSKYNFTTLAEEIGISRATLYKYVKGTIKEPKLFVILAIHVLLNEPMDHMLKKESTFFESGKTAGYRICKFENGYHLLETHDRLTFENSINPDGSEIKVILLDKDNELLNLKAGDYVVIKKVDKKYLFDENKDTYALIGKKYNDKSKYYAVIPSPYLTKITRASSNIKDNADGKAERSRHFVFIKNGKTYLSTQYKLANMIDYVVIQTIKHY